MNITEITNEIPTVGYDISHENFENILNVYEDKDNFYFYNLLKTIDFPKKLKSGSYTIYTCKPNEHYTTISYKFYNTTKLWWIICGANQIFDPTYPPYTGMKLKIITPEEVSNILGNITHGN